MENLDDIDEQEDTTEEFLKLKQNQPRPGDTLSSVDGQAILLTRVSRTEQGRQKTAVFCRAYADLDHEGWYLEGGKRGIICLILPQSQKRLVTDGDGNMFAEKLKVVRYTDNGRSILCDLV